MIASVALPRVAAAAATRPGVPSASANDKDLWVKELLSTVRSSIDKKIPIFGSCFGHQVIAKALGSKIDDEGRRIIKTPTKPMKIAIQVLGDIFSFKIILRKCVTSQST